ncbi:MAG: HD domain-containing protein [Candidatus Thermoplasmatota archaeon]
MIKREDIKKALPELKWIKDKKIRDKVIDVWMTAAEQGGWTNLNDIPFTLLIHNSGSLTEHTRRITKLSRIIMKARKEQLNNDYLLAGALLHDVGKCLEYKKKGEAVVKNEQCKDRHPVSGAKLAEEKGLPPEIVHIIYAHSKEGDNLKRSPEAIIVHHCDFIDFDIKKTLVG